MLNSPCHTSVQAFVDPKVLTIPVTDRIIQGIYAQFPLSARVISGYLSEEQLYWKINYHWEVLLEAVDHCAGLAIDDPYKRMLAAIRESLESNPPDPATGYRKSTHPGLPRDKSSHATILARHALVQNGKKNLKHIIQVAKILTKTTRKPKALELAYAPVAKPGKGKHSTGYALDIEGDNAAIRAVALSLGATLTFDEGSHVHCEWANGVDDSSLGGRDSKKAAQRQVTQSIDARVQVQRHCPLRNQPTLEA